MHQLLTDAISQIAKTYGDTDEGGRVPCDDLLIAAEADLRQNGTLAKIEFKLNGGATEQTLAHIRRVQSLLADVSRRLFMRAISHDKSKIEEPERSAFDDNTHTLKGLTYGSPEYAEALKKLGPALQHHYQHNSHHPEHWPGGINDMSLLDLIEMLVDWKAASERHADGSIDKSIGINKKRFGIDDQLESIMRRTVLELFPASRQPWHCFGCGAGGMEGNFCEMCGAGRNDYVAQGDPWPPKKGDR